MAGHEANASDGIDRLFGRARRLLLSRTAVAAGLFLVFGIQALVLASVFFARRGTSLGLLRALLPLGFLGLLLIVFLWLLAARSSGRLRRRVVRFLAGRDPVAHADIEAYFASHLVGGIRDETVREICRNRLAWHLAGKRQDLASHRFRVWVLVAWLALFVLLWSVPWGLGLSPGRVVSDFRRLLRLPSASLVVTKFMPEQQWLPAHGETAVRVAFADRPMGDVHVLLTDRQGDQRRIALRLAGETYVGSFPTPDAAFSLQVDCEGRTTPARTFNVYPQDVVTLSSVEAVDRTGNVTVTYAPEDFPITVPQGQRLRWYLRTAACPLRDHGLGSREAVVRFVRGRKGGSTWDAEVVSDGEFFTFWEAPGEAPVIQDHFEVKVIPDAPPSVTLDGPKQAAGETVTLPLNFTVAADDDLGVDKGVLAVADLSGWQEPLTLSWTPAKQGVRSEISVDRHALAGRSGRYLAVWATVVDNGQARNRTDSETRFYVLPEDNNQEGESASGDEPDDADQQPAPAEDLSSALAENLDRMAQADNAPGEQGEAAEDQADGTGEQAEAGQDQQPPDEGQTAQAAEPDEQGEQAQQAQPDQPNVADQGEPAQAGDQGNQGEAAQDQTAQADGQPGEDQGQAGEEAGQQANGQDQTAEANGQPGEDQGQAGGEAGRQADAQEQTAQGGGEQTQPGDGNPQGGEATAADAPPADQGQAGEGQTAQADGQPGEGQEQAATEGAQAGEGQGQAGAGENQAGTGQGEPGAEPSGQAAAQAQSGAGQAGQQESGDGQGTEAAAQAQSGAGQAGQQTPGSGQSAEATAQNNAAAQGQNGNQQGQNQAAAGQAEPADGQPAEGGTVAGTQPGGGQPGESPAPGGAEGRGQPPDEPPEGEKRPELTVVDESLRHAAATDGAGAAEKMGTIKAAEDGGEYAEQGETDQGREAWGTGKRAEAKNTRAKDTGEGDAGADDSTVAVTAEDLEVKESETKPNVDLQLTGAGYSGERKALDESAVEKAIRAHEKAMGKLTGTEKAATREYYRRLKDIK